MADGTATAQAATPDARGLTYPLGAPPAAGEAVEAAPGVLWLRAPLPIAALKHINVYAIADEDGWTIVDTGMRTPDTLAFWEAALAGPLGGRPVRRVICTHMHPDHIGLAGWLGGRFEAPLCMSRLEYVTGRMLVADTGKAAPDEGVRFYRRAGWSEAQLDAYRAEFGMFGKAVSPMPQTYVRLSDGESIRIGEDDWTVVVGSGHSPEHVCLWRRSDGVFISGDQILPRISSNVSVWPTEPEQDPLGDWLASLDRLERTLPDEVLVLPGHGDPFTGVKARIAALRRGHLTSLERLERALASPRRAVDVFASLFARPVDENALGLATGEGLAHLNYLTRRGRATRRRDEAGVDWWTVKTSEIPE